jgi:cell division protein FtsL
MGRTKTSRYRNWRKQMQEPRTWDTPNAAREREQLRKVEKAMDGVGWTAAIITGLLILLVIIVQVGKRFYGW